MHSDLLAEALFDEGVNRLRSGEFEKAEKAFRQVLELAPEMSEAAANLALLLERRKDWDAAEALYLKALDLAPFKMENHLNYGALLHSCRRLEEAEVTYRRALEIVPDAPAVWSNLGALLACAQRDLEAENCCRQALALDPQHRGARFNLAYLLLRQGRWDEGWACHEARFTYEPLANHLQCPRWDGGALDGRSILVGLEGGFGDMIQFCRYVPLLKKRGAARVSLLCQPALKRLFESLCGLDEVVGADDIFDAGGWDCWVPAMSLPYHFQTRVDSIPASLPYLGVSQFQEQRFEKIVGSPAGLLRVGVVWCGNPEFENDEARSLKSLFELAPIGALAGVRLFSLQKGAVSGSAPRGIPAEPPQLIDLAPELIDFSDTAAAILHLDLVISVDTAVAHLAGALAKPCWVLLPAYKADWRWLTERPDSPWYPGSMRLFRQGTCEEWSAVVARVCESLATMSESRKRSEKDLGAQG